MTDPAKPTPAQAYDSARAKVQKSHVYKTNQEKLTSECSCGEKASTLDIGNHIEEAAEKAGVAAREAARVDAQ